MIRKSTGILLGVFLAFALTARAASAQTISEEQVAQSAVNNGVAVTSNSKSSNTTPSAEELQAQLRAQQQELSVMKERLRKLEAMLTILAPRAMTPAITMDDVVAKGTAANRAKASSADTTPRELLPDIGQIGAEVNLFVGGAQNPYKSRRGFFAGGSIDLPLRRVPGGKLSYEILVTLQKSKTNIQVTSPVFALVNSALNRELGNPPSVNNLFNPLPITNPAEERSTILTVVPASLKYTVMAFDRYRFRPYVVAGLGTYVSLSTQNLKTFDASRYVAIPSVAALLNRLLQGPLIGGLAPAAPELRDRGIGQGQGDLRFGVNFGAGFEIRVAPKMSFGIDYRVNKIAGRNSTYQTLAFKQAFHF